MFDSTLKLIFPAEAKLPITIAAFFYVVVDHASIELLVEHLNAEITRFLFTLF